MLMDHITTAINTARLTDTVNITVTVAIIIEVIVIHTGILTTITVINR